MKEFLLYGSIAVLFYYYVIAGLGGRLMRWYDWGWWYRAVYLKSLHWKFKRWQKKMSFALSGRVVACEKCGSQRNLQIHHISYKHLYHEPLDELQIVCGYCHRKGSGRI